MRPLVLLLCLAGLAACNSPQRELALAEACDSYASALDQITPMKAEGKLSAGTVQAVEVTNSLTHPLCSTGAAPDDLEAAISAVSAASVQLKAIAQEAH